MIQNRTKPLFFLTLAAWAPVACVSPREKAPVAHYQQEATMRLAENYARDLAALRSLTSALSQIQVETTRADIEAELLSLYVTASGAADVEALRQRIEAAPSNSESDPLLDGVRAARISPEKAIAWLEDFALAWRMHAGVQIRAGLVAQLEPMKRLASAHDGLLESLDAHAAFIQRLTADALASGLALAHAHVLEREIAEPSQAALQRFWNETVLAEVRDPESRRLLEGLINDFAPSLAAPNTSEVSP